MVLLSAGVISLAAVSVSFVDSSFDRAVARDDKDEEGRLSLSCLHLLRPLDCSRNSLYKFKRTCAFFKADLAVLLW
jgi:hypothetical protein